MTEHEPSAATIAATSRVLSHSRSRWASGSVALVFAPRIESEMATRSFEAAAATAPTRPANGPFTTLIAVGRARLRFVASHLASPSERA